MGYREINLGLDNIKAALDLLSSPQDSFQSIIVAGTNGKGSVCTYLEQLFMLGTTEFEIGKYLSPHVLSVTERISISGEDISAEDFLGLWYELFGEFYLDLYDDLVLSPRAEEYRSHLHALNPEAILAFENSKIPLTFFEKMTALAFEYFHREGVEIAVLEVGLGGRLDAVNVVSSKNLFATVITSIGLDHQKYLGETLGEIRREKEGVIRKGVPHLDYSNLQQPEIELIADQYKIPTLVASNLLLAKKTYEALRPSGLDDYQIENIQSAFEKRIRGRFDWEPGSRVLLDGAHNSAAAKELAKFLEEFESKEPYKKLFLIVGFLDKDYEAFFEALLGGLSTDLANLNIFTVGIQNPRSTDPEETASFLGSKYLNLGSIQSFDSIEKAFPEAQKACSSKDLCLITGSLYLLGEYLALNIAENTHKNSQKHCQI